MLQSSIRLGDALTNDIAYTNSLQKLGRYETTLMNALTKTQQMLLDLQSSRREAETATAEQSTAASTPPSEHHRGSPRKRGCRPLVTKSSKDGSSSLPKRRTTQ